MTHRVLRLAFAACCLTALPAITLAHGPWVGPGAENVVRPLAGYFGREWCFSATAKCRMDSPHPSEWLEWEMQVAGRDGRLRAEVKADAIKGEPPIADEEIRRMRTIKITRTVCLSRPDAPTDLLLYPDVPAYVETARSEEDTRRAKARRTFKRRDLREELIDNHPCVKRQIVITAEGEPVAAEFTAWEGIQLPKFPYQLRFQTEDGTVTIRFRDVRFTSPDTAMFEPPAGARQFTTVVDLVREAGTTLAPAK